MTFLATASGLMIESVRSTAMRLAPTMVQINSKLYHRNGPCADPGITAGAGIGANAASPPTRSERAWQAEDVLGHVRQDQVGRNGCDLVEARLAELPLDVVFAGESEAAVGLQADIGGFPRCLGGEVLGHVGLWSAALVRVEAPARLEAHQVGRFGFDVGLGDRELHALVLAYRSI